MATHRTALSAPVPAPRKGRPPAPVESARRHQVQVRVDARTEALWRAFVARLQSEQRVGTVHHGDALRWLLEEDARRMGGAAA